MAEKEINFEKPEEEKKEEVQEEVETIPEEGIAKGLGTTIIENIDAEKLEKGDATYSSDDITVLEGLEAVRKRPGMYIGSTSSVGLHHLVWEIVDNAIDEALAGYCDEISVSINPGDTITVKDNGRGIPVDIVKKTGLSGLETVYTKLHAGGKFGDNSGYKVSGGLHGVGASVVNALSSYVEVTVNKNGGKYFLRFENGGKPVGHIQKIGDSNEHGTEVTFKPDPEIFKETTTYSYATINNRLRQMAFLNKGVKINLIDLRGEAPYAEAHYKYDGGIKEYVTFINKDSQILDPEVIYCEGAQEFQEKDNKQIIWVECAMQYRTDYNRYIYSYCNNVTTGDGGMHEDGFALAISRVFNKYARTQKLLKDNDKEKITFEDCTAGLTAVISVKHPNPQYEGQTKGKLGNLEVKSLVNNVVGEQLERFLMENKNAAQIILKKVIAERNARLASKAARENARKKNGIELSTMPGKLADCSSNNPEECELFIVEGNSAGGSAKQGRDSHFQAILPLRGKILNVQKAQEHRIFENGEIGNLITAIGGGYGSEFDVSKIRYHKVVIMTDADVDGSHIRVLLLTFFHKFMRPLIDNGFVYIAQPPLYKLTFQKKDYYAYSDDQLEEIKIKLGINKENYPVQRYKGLGEMDPSQLEETTMDPAKRKMLKVTLEDALAANEVFDQLMGEEVAPRTEFIEKNAQFVKNLDI